MSEDEENLSLFRQEAEELLGEITEALLALETPDVSVPEQVNRIFRGVHTIKGLAAMCEITALAAFAHRVEDVLAKLRSESSLWSSEITTAMLAAVDRFKLLLERDATAPEDQESEPILTTLETAAAQLSRARKKQTAKKTTAGKNGRSAKAHLYYIKLEAGRSQAAGVEAPSIVDSLQKLGACTVFDHQGIQRILLETGSSPSAISDSLFFLPEDCYTVTLLGEASDLAGKRLHELAMLLQNGCEPAAAWRAIHAAAAPAAQLEQVQPIRNLRISSERLDRLVEIVGEIVVTQGRIAQLAANTTDTKWSQPVEDMSRLVDSLRDVAMNIRMMPVGNIFRVLNRMARDVSTDLGKEVNFITSGGETEMDKAVLDKLMDPLLHLVRNSLDHGIGTPDERLAAGKPRRGTVRLDASHEAGQVIITIQDDGNGVSLDKVRARGLEAGLITPEQHPTQRELYALLFTPGFSTRSEVTNLSGRGVGLDVVRRQVDTLRGSVDMKSEAGAGTTITLRLPLTLAIIDGLLVEVNEALYVLPLSVVRECMDFPAYEQEQRTTRMVTVRDEPIPFLDARGLFEHCGWMSSPSGIAILIEHDGSRFVLVVDRVLGDLQTVVKSVGALFRQAKLISGATVLGDGSLALILDPAALARELTDQSRPSPASSFLN